MLSYHVPSACFVALDVEEGGSRPIWWHVIRGPEGDVQTERVRNDLNDTVTEMLHSCDETTDIVPLGMQAPMSFV